MLERIEKVEAPLRALAGRLETIKNEELIQFAGEALKAVKELKEHERLLSEIF